MVKGQLSAFVTVIKQTNHIRHMPLLVGWVIKHPNHLLSEIFYRPFNVRLCLELLDQPYGRVQKRVVFCGPFVSGNPFARVDPEAIRNAKD